MTHYHLSRDQHRGRHLAVSIQLATDGQKTLELLLPNWRPGRYELANYARNVVGFKVLNSAGEPIKYRKTGRFTWEVTCDGLTEINIQYSYYANQPDAGGCWVDDQLLYVNPVNCLLYTHKSRTKACSLTLDLKTDEKVATGLKKEDQQWIAADFDELADQPILCSADIEHQAFQVDEVVYHLWFYGITAIPWEQINADFIAFTKAQLRCMGPLPVKEFHYINLILPFAFYHGVEHRNNTVIALGPATEIFTKLYSELLGVSSHELFHCWNVKFIKPKPFAPYAYDRENYSPLGYVYEGFTTYYGDLFLYRSKVFDWEAYTKEVNVYLKRHFDNYGRFNHSLHESSIDTWVDGYGGPAAPNRRVSIYAEGMLNAWLLDLHIRKNSQNQVSLDDLMRALYADAQAGKNYDENRLLEILNKLTGHDFEPFFEKHYRQPISLEAELHKALDWIGCKLLTRIQADPIEAWLGVRGNDADGWRTITAIAPGSPAALAGLMVEDQLKLEHHLSRADWKAEPPAALIWKNKMGLLREVGVQLQETTYFNHYTLEKQAMLTVEQENAFRAWSNG